MKLMKKILLSLAALAFAATMNAQVWIGGEVGFTTNHTNDSDHTAMELTIAPDIGYSLSGNSALPSPSVMVIQAMAMAASTACQI